MSREHGIATVMVMHDAAPLEHAGRVLTRADGRLRDAWEYRPKSFGREVRTAS